MFRRSLAFFIAGMLLCCQVVFATPVTYVVSVRDSTITAADNRKTGLSLTFPMFKKLSDGSSVTPPAISEVGLGQYKFTYDAETSGEVSWQIDAAGGITNYSDRFLDGTCTLNDTRILTGISSSGQVVASSVQGSVTGSVASVTGAVGSVTGSIGSISGITFPANFGTFSINGSGLVTLTAGEHTAISSTDVPAALTAQGYTTARAPKLDNLDAATSTRLPTSSYSAAPSAATIAALILTDPTHPIATDSSGSPVLSAAVKQSIADLTWSHVVDGGITASTWLSALGSVAFGTSTNSYNLATHTLTTTFKAQDANTTTVIVQTVYGTGTISVPVTSRASTVTH